MLRTGISCHFPRGLSFNYKKNTKHLPAHRRRMKEMWRFAVFPLYYMNVIRMPLGFGLMVDLCCFRVITNAHLLPVYQPASFEVMVSSYSSRTLSSLSFSRRSQIIPTCLRVNNGCSFLVGETPPEDVPVQKQTKKPPPQESWPRWYFWSARVHLAVILEQPLL